METRKQIAAEKLQCGTHNCAQAIVSTYADLIGLDETTAKTLPMLLEEEWATWKEPAAHL